MKYFLHDTNAFQDEKVSQLFIQFGYEGVGLFYTLLEKLGAQEKPIKTSVLKMQLHIGKKLEKVWSFMEEIELISSKNGETFNENILKFSEKYQIKKEKTRERVAKFREQGAENQEDVNSVTRYNDVTEYDSNAPKVKESEVKESKEEKRLISPNGSGDKSPALITAYKELEKNNRSIYEFIKTNKPGFIEPYIFYWNLFADKFKKARVASINDKRKKKFAKRMSEEPFDFIEIIRKAGQSELLTIGNWFSFDWIFENESNYLKVLEGNYDNNSPKQQNNSIHDLSEYKRKRQQAEAEARSNGY